MIRGAEQSGRKRQRKKTGHQASAQTKVYGYVCPANRELITNYIGLSLLALLMFWPFQETDASNPNYAKILN